MQNTFHKMNLDPQTSAEKISRLKTSITSDFIERTRFEIEGMRKLDVDGVIDSLNEFLESLSRSLQLKSLDGTQKRVGFNHGMIRSQQRYFSAEDLFLEFRILIRIIHARLREGADLTEEADAIITDSVLNYLESTIKSFDDHQKFRDKNFSSLAKTNLAKELELTNKELEDFIMDAELPMFMTVGKKHRLTLANSAFHTTCDDIFPDLEPILSKSFTSNKVFCEKIVTRGNIEMQIYLHPYHERNGMIKGLRGIIFYPQSTGLNSH